jgi:glutaredoxin 3
MAEVKIYTTSTCIYCRAEKQFLDQHGIKYQEMKADQDQDLAEELLHLSGQLAVPYTVIKKDDGSSESILGFDQPRIAHALGLH